MKTVDAPAELLQFLADSIPGLVSLLNRKLEYRYLNAKYADWFGIDTAEFIGKTPRDLMGAGTYKEMEPLFHKALNGEHVVEERAMAYKYGVSRYVRTYLTPHINQDGEVTGVWVHGIDISEERKTHEMLEEALQSKSRFLAAASHDLRQPLHALNLLMQTLRRRLPEDSETVELVEYMDETLASLRGMFEALLNVSKLDAGLMKVDPQVVNLKALLQKICQTFAPQADRSGLRLSLQACDAYVETDPVMLEMTISNLIANALKFTSEGGILVGCKRRRGNIHIEVYDTGPGIPESRIKRIFNEFEHSKKGARGGNDGMGLGLSLVRRYCDLMNYELGVRSRIGHGSRFSIILPEVTVEKDKPKPVEQKKNRSDQSLGGAKILVLDDERQVTYALSRNLQDQGAEAIPAVSLDEAENLLSPEKWPDAAIVDYDLRSDEMGDAFISRLEKKHDKKLPTLILTGSTDPESLKALAASGRRWLTKPVDPDMLSAAIAGLLRD